MGSNTKHKGTPGEHPRPAQSDTIKVGSDELRVVSFEERSPRIPACLSEAEADIATRLAAGQSTADIAVSRGVSERTVQTQLRNMFKKLGVQSQAALLAALYHDSP